MSVRVWAFNKPDTEENVRLLHESVKNGKSRFGWSREERHNLKIDRGNNWKNNWTEEHSKQLFLLRIKPDDWIVHIHMPSYGWCVAAKVVRGYDFDEGINTSDGQDFRHVFQIDVGSIVEFERNDWRIHPRINLTPRGRQHRVYEVEEFLMAIERIRSGTSRTTEEGREQYHLWEDTKELLEKITFLIHKTHKAKKLEGFLAKVFERIPGVVDVEETGSGWGTDHGRDLSVTARVSVEGLDLEHKIVVQVKSHEGVTSDTTPVEQIKNAIRIYDADAGMIVTTGERTRELEEAVNKAADELGCPIHLLAGKEVAQFVIKNAVDRVFRLP